MIRTATRLTTLAAFAAAMLSISPVAGPLSGAAMAASTDTPAPPASDGKSTKDKKKSGEKGSAIERPDFLQNYRAAYAAVYDRQDYAGAIAQLQALGADDRADVANLIGYANRKLGNYQVAQLWYERALKADPAHVRTWQYYGLWQVEQGNRDQAQYHLKKIGALCGTDCGEYRSLAAALQQPPGSGLSY
jgi:tetratricopeptide (TPR) repeat protein